MSHITFLFVSTGSDSYYNSVKQAAKMNVTGAKSIFDDLNKRFERAKTGNGTPTTPAE